MLTIDVAIVGGGPAGLAAGIAASKAGAKVLLISEDTKPGGQLIKQTHKFFGSSEYYAGIRGYEIAKKLSHEAEKAGVKIWINSVVYGIFNDKTLGVMKNDKLQLLKAKKIIFACGALEKVINFPGWTLPGVMLAGAAQTMVNVHRVLPGKRCLMIGSGNVGLVISYQLLQAGIDVVAVVEKLPRIGGYGVHASKIRRLGVPILTSHTIKRAHGKREVEAATVVALDECGQPIPGSEKRFKVDMICLAVGLRPNIELPLMAGCKTMYLPALGGFVPIHDENMETTKDDIYVAGDTSGVEEASTAIITGRLAGISVSEKLGYLSRDEANELKMKLRKHLDELRSGPFGMKRKIAKQKLIQAAASLKKGR